MSDKPCNRGTQGQARVTQEPKTRPQDKPAPHAGSEHPNSTPQSVLGPCSIPAPLRGDTHNCWALTLEHKLSGDSDIKTKQPHGTAARPKVL